MLTRIVRAFLAGSLMLVLGQPASAHVQTTLDPDDSPGPLDLVVTQHRDRKTTITLRLVTYEEWENDVFSDSESFIAFEFNDPEGDFGIERCIRIPAYNPSEASESQGQVYRGCDIIPFYEPIGSVESVTRPDLHSIVVRVKKTTLWKRMPKEVSWRGLTSYEKEGDANCPPPEQLPPEHFYGTCTDYSKWKTHRY